MPQELLSYNGKMLTQNPGMGSALTDQPSDACYTKGRFAVRQEAAGNKVA